MPERVLTQDEVAKRVEYAITRCLKVLMDIRQVEGFLYEDIRGSRFITNAGDFLAAELNEWGFEAERSRGL
jgi:hypothetical protein